MRDSAGRPAPFSTAVMLIVCAVALVLRLIGLRYGLPAVYNPDEVAIMSRALAFAKGDLNPHNFLYPSFYFYALFAWEGLTAVCAVADRRGRFVRRLSASSSSSTRRASSSRAALLTALCGTATVVATGVRARRAWSARHARRPPRPLFSPSRRCRA